MLRTKHFCFFSSSANFTSWVSSLAVQISSHSKLLEVPRTYLVLSCVCLCPALPASCNALLLPYLPAELLFILENCLRVPFSVKLSLSYNQRAWTTLGEMSPWGAGVCPGQEVWRPEGDENSGKMQSGRKALCLIHKTQWFEEGCLEPGRERQKERGEACGRLLREELGVIWLLGCSVPCRVWSVSSYNLILSSPACTLALPPRTL